MVRGGEGAKKSISNHFTMVRLVWSAKLATKLVVKSERLVGIQLHALLGNKCHTQPASFS
jgi:hypothetical protein